MIELTPFKDGHTYKFGFKNSAGKIVIAPVYDNCFKFSDGYAACCFGGDWGFINEYGQTVIPFKYFSVGSFNYGLAAVRINDLWGYINKQGKVVIKPRFCMVNNFCYQRMMGLYAEVNIAKGREIKQYVINEKGKIIEGE